MNSPHAMYASVVCERHRALSVAAEAQVSFPWYVFLMTTRALRGTLRVVVPSCTARQSAPSHSSSSVPVWMSRPLVEVGGGAGEMRRDLLHLRRVSEAEALISGAEGRERCVEFLDRRALE